MNTSDECQFYCVECDDFFLSGLQDIVTQEASCQKCGVTCQTTDWHVMEMERENDATHSSQSMKEICSIILLVISVGGFLLKQLLVLLKG